MILTVASDRGLATTGRRQIEKKVLDIDDWLRGAEVEASGATTITELELPHARWGDPRSALIAAAWSRLDGHLEKYPGELDTDWDRAGAAVRPIVTFVTRDRSSGGRKLDTMSPLYEHAVLEAASALGSRLKSG